MKRRVAQSPNNSKCETAPLSALDWSNWDADKKGIMVKAEKGNKRHLVIPTKGSGTTIGERNGDLVWVSET